MIGSNPLDAGLSEAHLALLAKAPQHGYVCPRWKGPFIYLLRKEIMTRCGQVYRLGKPIQFPNASAASDWLDQQGRDAS